MDPLTLPFPYLQEPGPWGLDIIDRKTGCVVQRLTGISRQASLDAVIYILFDAPADLARKLEVRAFYAGRLVDQLGALGSPASGPVPSLPQSPSLDYNPDRIGDDPGAYLKGK